MNTVKTKQKKLSMSEGGRRGAVALKKKIGNKEDIRIYYRNLQAKRKKRGGGGWNKGKKLSTDLKSPLWYNGDRAGWNVERTQKLESSHRLDHGF